MLHATARLLRSFSLMVLLCGACAGAELPWLKVKGMEIVDAKGSPVILRGPNLGGWFVEEIWMMPFVADPPAGSDMKKIVDHHTLWTTIEQRLGKPAMMRIRTAFRENWITEADFARIKAAGFNHVRLPFLYDLFDEPGGWAWIDRAIGWAAKHELYVVLDLHGAPGGQSDDHHTGFKGVNKLFYDEQKVEETKQLWRRIAMRYHNRSTVAAYDLLNEPMGAPDQNSLWRVQGELYKAIRSVDDRHAIIFEDGYKGLQDMPIPAEVGWNNVIASRHHYIFDAKSTQRQIDGGREFIKWVKGHRDRVGVPLYVGEFNQEPWGTPQSLAQFTREMEAEGFSWSIWSYKKVVAGGTRSMWGMYRNPKPVEPIDAFRDTEQQMIDKCAAYRTENLEVKPELIEALAKPGK
jgi:hypothetical protein